MHYRLTVKEDEDPIPIKSREDLVSSIESATAEAQRLGRPNIVFLDAENGNNLSLVLGTDETVVNFVYGHQDPPYYVSKGKSDAEVPVFTAFAILQHHTEYPRRWVIPIEDGMAALFQFFETAALPDVVQWETT